MTLPTADELRALVARLQDLRPILAVPYSYEIDGEVWTLACDGHGLLAVRRDDGCLRADLVPLAPKFAGVIEPRPTEGWRPIDAGALVAWANDAAPDPAKCLHCQGTGTLPANTCKECDGKGVVHCTCDACGDEHESDCECDGIPDTEAPCDACNDPREVKGWFGAALINRANVWRWLSWLPADAPVEAVVTAPLHVIRFRGPDWFALVMPMRYQNDHPFNVGVFEGWLEIAPRDSEKSGVGDSRGIPPQ